MNQSIKEFYDIDGSTYLERRWYSTPIAQFDFNATRSAVLFALGNSSYRKGLEIGPGPGTWTPLILEKADELTLVEISNTMLSQAKERLKEDLWKGNVNFIESDFMKVILIDQFDLVIAIRCFEYFSDKIEFLKKCRRLLNRDGKLIIISKTKGSYWYGRTRIRRILKRILPSLFIHEANIEKGITDLFSQERLFVRDAVSLLKSCGFNNIIVRPVILRPPIFMRGKSEIPLVTRRLERPFLKFFKAFDRVFSRFPRFTIFAESYLVIAHLQ